LYPLPEGGGEDQAEFDAKQDIGRMGTGRPSPRGFKVVDEQYPEGVLMQEVYEISRKVLMLMQVRTTDEDTHGYRCDSWSCSRASHN